MQAIRWILFKHHYSYVRFNREESSDDRSSRKIYARSFPWQRYGMRDRTLESFAEGPCRPSLCFWLVMQDCSGSSMGMWFCSQAKMWRLARFPQLAFVRYGTYGKADRFRSRLGTVVFVWPFQQRCSQWTKHQLDMNNVASRGGLLEHGLEGMS